ncbi:MAG: hypothetical protein J6V70_05050 [Kiritimatiellae bacterium]|nr:hypothetical protein [Kiritimatiellia bacterium]
MENANQEKEDLSSYNDIISKLLAVPEEQFTDISEKVMSAIKHERAITQQLYKRMLYSGIGVGAAAIALCIGLGFYMSQPSSEAIEQFASVEPKVAPIETVVAESAPTMSIYDVVALLQKLESNELEATDSQFAHLAELLVQNQKTNGFFGDVLTGAEENYNHSMATLTLVKLYETGAYPELFTPLDAALGYIRSNQTERGSWGDIYRGSNQIGILNVAVLGIAQDLGWADISGHLRRGLRCLETSTNAGLSNAGTIEEKLAIIHKLGKQIYTQRNS